MFRLIPQRQQTWSSCSSSQSMSYYRSSYSRDSYSDYAWRCRLNVRQQMLTTHIFDCQSALAVLVTFFIQWRGCLNVFILEWSLLVFRSPIFQHTSSNKCILTHSNESMHFYEKLIQQHVLQSAKQKIGSGWWKRQQEKILSWWTYSSKRWVLRTEKVLKVVVWNDRCFRH